ncbi:MAG TPA: radical SAM protein [Elusimicrobiota bacterium]|nr:radical SAM protein [Elusimicrobiota bacterium]
MTDGTAASQSGVSENGGAATMPSAGPRLSEFHRTMPVFYNWEIHYSCNYRCSYCPFTVSGWHTFSSKNAYPPLSRLESAWRRLYERYGKGHIAISGGEPCTYPEFVPLVQTLTRMHSVELNTNLSFDEEKFAAAVDLKRIRLAASFHPQFAAFEDFFKRTVYFKERGVDIFVNYVSFPEQLEEMWRYKKEFQAAGVPFYIMPFNGKYEERVYPQGATEREKACYDAAMNGVDPETWINRQRREWPGHPGQYFPNGVTPSEAARLERQGEKRVVPPVVAPELAAAAKRAPVLCLMGYRYCKIRPNGETYRCCAWLAGNTDLPKPIYLGNLYEDEKFSLLEEPAMCDYTPCPCERCMVVGEEDRWRHRWVTTE